MCTYACPAWSYKSCLEVEQTCGIIGTDNVYTVTKLRFSKDIQVASTACANYVCVFRAVRGGRAMFTKSLYKCNLNTCNSNCFLFSFLLSTIQVFLHFISFFYPSTSEKKKSKRSVNSHLKRKNRTFFVFFSLPTVTFNMGEVIKTGTNKYHTRFRDLTLTASGKHQHYSFWSVRKGRKCVNYLLNNNNNNNNNVLCWDLNSATIGRCLRLT